ncbi:MAG: 50S ribosomal protein L6 [Deltaproteobacteria bacterium]|nr:50S ribosomal protein L6 [Deltaproteobacteria bacterium]
MSRVGKKPVSIPQGVRVALAGASLSVEGPKGKLLFSVPPEIKVAVEKDRVVVTRGSDLKTVRQKHGMVRSVISNMVTGVTAGFQRTLEVQGVGYKVEKQGEDKLAFTIGYSHPVIFALPPGIKASIEKNVRLTITGADKHALGQVAANIRAIKHADPYKLKGIKYAEERIKQKVGKTGAA